MSTGLISSARAQLLEALTEASSLPVIASIPERLEPPCVVITEASPFLEVSELAHGAVAIRFTANVVEAPTDGPLALRRLDEHTDEIITALIREWDLSVEAYTTVSSADQQRYLTAPITFTTYIQ